MMQSTSDERRTHNRIAFDASVTISVTGTTFESTLLDISMKGVLIRKPDDWYIETDTSCQLDISLSNQDSINMTSSFLWKKGNVIGMHCDSIDLDSMGKLRRLVELNLNDESMLDRELAALVH